MTSLDLQHLQRWVGKTERGTDTVTARIVEGLRATLEIASREPRPHAALPASLHWCLAPAIEPPSKLAVDGHGLKGDFLPPVPLPLRMWASGEITRHDSFHIGDSVERVSRIAEVEAKKGRTGQLCFVTIDHNFSTARGLALHERQNIVYRETAQPGVTVGAAAPASPAPPAQWQNKVEIDAVRLFRYSALTFNGHRIHFDRDYCRVEGYPGLVVHGPLQASFLVELATSIRAGRAPRVFKYRAVRPLFEAGVLTLNARESADGLDLWAEGYDGATTLKAQAQW